MGLLVRPAAGRQHDRPRAGLVDELQLLVAPALIGGRDTPSMFDGPELADGEPPTRLRLLTVHAEADGMLWLRYEVTS